MGWSIGFDTRWQRDIGYGVPATCDHPECGAKIDRGLSYVCGGEPYGGDEGCGLYFCSAHLLLCAHARPQLCERCADSADHFAPKPDHPQWIAHKMVDDSWADWRKENPKWAGAQPLVFVFGSNLAGRHGKGAALAARLEHGAVLGVGVGRTGKAYAIPTKDERLRVLPLETIRRYVFEFGRYAADNPATHFAVTRVGCGLAGYTDAQMAPLFEGAPPNVWLPEAWQ